jgi:lysozyme
MKTSETGIQMIKNFESCKLNAYKDKKGILTIGYGHTGNVKEGDKITLVQAENILITDIENAEIPAKALNTTLTMKSMQLTQNQFDMIVSLCFNIGNHRFTESALFSQIAANPVHHYIIHLWMQFVRSGNEILIDLINRRSKELSYYYSSIIISL